jgi:hypothetical protein
MSNIQLEKQYPFSRPGLTLQIFILGLIVVSGLIALFFAAFHAFRLVAEPTQAFFAALVIEAGLIAECLAIINKPRSVAPWLGLVISYVVSGTYNYTQAAKAGEGLGGWELGALAFGPLSALAVVSLAFGNELRSYQERVEDWSKTRAGWVEGEWRRLETLATEREQKRLEVEAQQKQAQLELQAKQKQAQLEAEQKHAEKMARIEAKKDKKVTRNKPTKKRISKIEKREISISIIRENPLISGAELGRQLGSSERTGQTILNELTEAGAIHRNGSGWQVLR